MNYLINRRVNQYIWLSNVCCRRRDDISCKSNRKPANCKSSTSSNKFNEELVNRAVVALHMIQFLTFLASITIFMFKSNRLIDICLMSCASWSSSKLFKSAATWLHEARQDRNAEISSLGLVQICHSFVYAKLTSKVKMQMIFWLNGASPAGCHRATTALNFVPQLQSWHNL